MQKIANKARTFGVEIRRAHRRKIIKEMRTSFIQHQQTNNQFQQFMATKSTIIPIMCVERFEELTDDLLNEFKRMEKSTKFFFDPSKQQQNKQTQDGWLFDCSSLANIRFAINLGGREVTRFFDQFVAATIESNSEYAQFQLEYQLTVSESKCYITSKTLMPKGEQTAQRSMAHQIQHLKNSPQQTERILLTLKLWGVYLREHLGSIELSHFLIIVRSFCCWMDNFPIELCPQPYQFADEMVSLIMEAKIIKKPGERITNILQPECELFVHKVKTVIHRAYAQTDFPELAMILIKFYPLSLIVPGLFFQALFNCFGLKGYILKLLSSKGQQGTSTFYEQNQRVGIDLLHCLYDSQNPSEFLSTSMVLQSLQIISEKCIFNSRLVESVIALIYHMVREDDNNDLEEVVAEIDFERVMGMPSVEVGDLLQYVLQLQLLSLKKYNGNRKLAEKIIVRCDLEKRLRQHCLRNQEFEYYQQFARIIDREMDDFVHFYPWLMPLVLQFVDQFDFIGKKQFIQELEKRLKIQQENNRK